VIALDQRRSYNINQIIRERTNYSYFNCGILTVGLKLETVEIAGIIFLRPQPPKPRVLEIMSKFSLLT
jgi:hypothetical protein